MSKFICDKCQLELGSHPALYRHKLHSCKNNPHKTPRKDKLDQKSKQINNAPITATIDTTDKDDNMSGALVPIDRNHIMDMFMQNDPDMQAITKFEEDCDDVSNILKKILDNQNALATSQKNLVTSQKNLEKKLDNTLTGGKPSKNPNNFNIDKIQIYLTDPVDFVDVLEKRMGSRKKAIDFVRSKVNKKTEGDVDLFCEIYLQGDPETWSISCQDKKHHIYHIIKPSGGIISDPGGSEIYKIFRSNYTNTLLKLSNTYIKETLNLKTDSMEYEKARDELLDVFDLGSIQEKVCALCNSSYNPFIKKLSVKLTVLENHLL